MHYVIVNADDFGSSEGINHGIIAAHEQGIVTSTSLMVNTPATAAAVKLARAYPNLGLGLHVNLTGEGERLVDLEDRQAVKRELEEQFNRFVDLTGQFPTHLDSHQHVHREFNVGHLFVDGRLDEDIWENAAVQITSGSRCNNGGLRSKPRSWCWPTQRICISASACTTTTPPPSQRCRPTAT